MLQAFTVLLAATLVGGPNLHQEGVALYKQHKYQEAIATLEKASQGEAPASPDFKESALLIGQSYFMLSQSAKAIPWLEKVTNTNEANYMLGYAYVLANRYDDSEAAFARLFGMKADSAAGHLVAAEMLVKKEFEKYAVTEARKAVAMDPKLPGAHFLLGEIAIYSGQPQEGLAEMSAEIGINPTFSMAWYRRGDAYTRQENWAAAIPDLQRAIWLNPNFSGPYILLGKCYFKLADYSNAEGMLRHALVLDPRNTSANYLLAQTLSSEGKKEEAKQLLDKVRATNEAH